MMRKFLWFLIAIAALAAGVWMLYATDHPKEEWSCEPEAANQELEAGLAANMKYYHADALSHFERALELAPDCAMAQLAVLRRIHSKSERYEELLAKLEETDLDALSDREAFLVRFHLAGFHKDWDEQHAILDAYLERHPKDPYALEHRCEILWAEEKTDEGETCYERLIHLNPNWVVAQNRLGYLAMARGELDRAEDRFRTYRYVAPDQANPHDSLGELLALRGRYDEARAELEEALAVRPDFCASYEHLIFVSLDQGKTDEARAYLHRGTEVEACAGIHHLECEVESFALYLDEDWPSLAARWEDPCHSEKLSAVWLPHLGALMTGDLALARTIEGTLEGVAKKYRGKPIASHDLDLLVGLRLLAEGDPQAAEEVLRRTDKDLLYKNMQVGRLKLYSRLVLAEALARQGKEDESQRLVEEVEAVNPYYAEIYRSGELPLPGGP